MSVQRTACPLDSVSFGQDAALGTCFGADGPPAPATCPQDRHQAGAAKGKHGVSNGKWYKQENAPTSSPRKLDPGRPAVQATARPRAASSLRWGVVTCRFQEPLVSPPGTRPYDVIRCTVSAMGISISVGLSFSFSSADSRAAFTWSGPSTRTPSAPKARAIATKSGFTVSTWLRRP